MREVRLKMERGKVTEFVLLVDFSVQMCHKQVASTDAECPGRGLKLSKNKPYVALRQLAEPLLIESLLRMCRIRIVHASKPPAGQNFDFLTYNNADLLQNALRCSTAQPTSIPFLPMMKDQSNCIKCQ